MPQTSTFKRRLPIVAWVLASLSLAACGGSSGSSNSDDAYVAGGSSSGAAAAKLAVGNTITFSLPASAPGFSQNQSFSIVSSSRAYQSGSSAMSGTYTYTTSGSTATFEYKRNTASETTTQTYTIRFTSAKSGTITKASLVYTYGSAPTAPLRTVYSSGTFRIN